jgi:hypothetical protein
LNYAIVNVISNMDTNRFVKSVLKNTRHHHTTKY